MKLLRTKMVDSRRSRWVGALMILILVLIGLLIQGSPPGIHAAPLGQSGTANAVEPSHLIGVTAIITASCSNNDPLNPYNNAHDAGQCTWWAWEKRHQIGQDLPSVAWGDAKAWLGNAISAGYPTGDVPLVGAVVVCQPGACGGAYATGHVAYVEKVFSSTSFQVSEQNWLFGPCTNDLRTVSTGPGVSFIYFLVGPPTPTVTPPMALPVCTPFAVLPTPTPFPTETEHVIFLPYLSGGGQVVCNTQTPTPSPAG